MGVWESVLFANGFKDIQFPFGPASVNALICNNFFYKIVLRGKSTHDLCKDHWTAVIGIKCLEHK